MSRLTANLFMNSFNENLECLKTVLKRKDLWQDLWEIKKAKEDYYINKLMFLETGSLMKDATVWFDNKSMPTFKAKCLGQILLTGPYKVYIKRTGTQVDKLNTCNMSVTSYTVTFK